MAPASGSQPDNLQPVRGVRRLLRAGLRVALDPVLTVPGYWLATGFGLAWGGILSRGRLERTDDGLFVATGLPTWSYGRGGTTVGGVYLTTDNVTPASLEHEEVHRRQWQRFGLMLLPLYYASGRDPLKNHFEIDADLVKGGYVKAPRRPVRRRPPVTTDTTPSSALRDSSELSD